MYHKNHALFVVAGFLLFVSGSLYAQTPQDLRFGTSASGNLRAGEEQWFRIRPTEAGLVTVETSGDLDTYLEAYDASNNRIAENDDAGDGSNARLEILCTAGSTYLFKLRGYDSSVNGPFRIWASSRPIPPATELRFGSSLSGNLSGGADQWYSVRSSSAGLVTVETSGDLDTYLEAYDASNKRIAENDDGGEDTNARLEIYCEAGVTYRFRVRGFSSSASGPYRIWASLGPITELRPGSSLSGNLSGGVDQWYSVRPSSVGFVTVETSSDIDTFLELYDAPNNRIAENDDGGDGSNARLEVLCAAGSTYLFKLRGYDSSVNGPYRISASFRAIPQATELRFGSSLSGNLSRGTDQWYSVRPSSAGFVTVETSGDLDTYLELYDASNNRIAENDDDGEGSNARLEISCEAGVTYRFRVRGYSSSVSGTYRILASFEGIPSDTEGNIERSRAISIRLGESTPVFFRASESRWYRYEITRAGTQFVVQTRGNIDTTLSLYDAQGNLITEDDDSGDDYNAMISQRLNPGIVYIKVGQYNAGIGRCTLHAEIR